MNTIVLDDGIEYAIVKEEVINGTEYTLFANVNDNSKICFRTILSRSSINNNKKASKRGPIKKSRQKVEVVK